MLVGDQVFQQEARTVAEFAARALGRWTGTIVGTWKIRNAVSNRRVLGANSDLKRKNYAMSPILQIILQCMNRHGTVFVVHGGGGMGKTTALFAVMGRYTRKGVGFSPGELSGEYKEMMLRRLSLDPKFPPNGWLEKFLDELKTPWGEPPAVLMLDDFMNERPNDPLDRALLKNIKTAIRGKNIVVFALTTNERSANLMITWNTMNSIVPAAPDDDVRRWRRLYRDHQNGRPDADDEFAINWNEQSRMRWETDALKTAVLVSPNYVEKSDAEKTLVEANIDEHLRDIDEEERETINPSALISHLARTQNIDILESPRDGWGPNWNCSGGFWGNNK